MATATDNTTLAAPARLVDRFGRVHTHLRISVTDRCNIRCTYCMPEGPIRFLPRAEILTYEEIERFVRSVVPLGIGRLRLTGGEPLMRAELDRLVSRLKSIRGIEEIALTTNGILLAPMAERLKAAGLDRLNISLDTLDPEMFRRIARREGLERVLAGIEAAIRAGFTRIRLNALAMAGQTESQIVPLAEFARQRGLELRFIEYMPLDGSQAWTSAAVLSGAVILDTLAARFGPLRAVPPLAAGQPAEEFLYGDGIGRVGIIRSVTEPFCGSCNRLRLTAEGQVRNCLFGTAEWDARALLRGAYNDDDLRQLVIDCVRHKKAGHGTDSPEFQRPDRAMYQIGG
jgi:cyclic pyranopterin phosphate synthase